jgi:ribosomal protein S21
MINIEVERNPNENNANIIRKFTKRVQEAGILNRIRGIRYYSRTESKYVQKKKALKSIGRRKDMDTLIKLGKAKLRQNA